MFVTLLSFVYSYLLFFFADMLNRRYSISSPSRRKRTDTPTESTLDECGGLEKAALATVFGVREYIESTYIWDLKKDPSDSTYIRDNKSSHSLNSTIKSNQRSVLNHDINRQKVLPQPPVHSTMLPNSVDRLPTIPAISEFGDKWYTAHLENEQSYPNSTTGQRSVESTEKVPVDTRSKDLSDYPLIIYDYIMSDDNKYIILWGVDTKQKTIPPNAPQPIEENNWTPPPLNRQNSIKTKTKWLANKLRLMKQSDNDKDSRTSMNETVPDSYNNKNRIIIAATIEKLIETLTKSLDYSLVTDFFLTYRIFMTPLQLCKLLILRFKWSLVNNEESRCLVRIRTFVVFRHWLTNYYQHDFVTNKDVRLLLSIYLNSMALDVSIMQHPLNRKIIRSLTRTVKSLQKDYNDRMASGEVIQPRKSTYYNTHQPSRNTSCNISSNSSYHPYTKLNTIRPVTVQGNMYSNDIFTSKDPFNGERSNMSLSSDSLLTLETTYCSSYAESLTAEDVDQEVIPRTIKSDQVDQQYTDDYAIIQRKLNNRSFYMAQLAIPFIDSSTSDILLPGSAHDNNRHTSQSNDPSVCESINITAYSTDSGSFDKMKTLSLSGFFQLNQAKKIDPLNKRTPVQKTVIDVTPSNIPTQSQVPLDTSSSVFDYYKKPRADSQLTHDSTIKKKILSFLTPILKEHSVRPDQSCSAIIHYSTSLLSQQFCLIERDILMAIHWEELVDCRNNRWDQLRGKKGKGIETAINRFNAVCHWVSSEILSTKEKEDRAKVIEKFIRLAKKCKLHYNFSTLMQILLGLQSPTVSRLEKTWALVGRKEMKILHELSIFTSPTKNWKNIRDSMTVVAEEYGASPTEIQEGQPINHPVVAANNKLPYGGCIPFLGIYLSDLVFNAEIADYIANNHVTHHNNRVMDDVLTQPLIHFRKHRIIAAVIKRVFVFQALAKRYAFEKSADESLYTLCFHVESPNT
ncbi:ras guanine nucleotide exchange factor domain-containing protein [Pilobolus umbonatus]|nr:ras guanine nucleotide exchange factor domain-containing protein [Pilobolus umbonatus]